LLLDPARPRVVLLARPVVERDAAARLPLVEPPVARPQGAAPPAWVNEAMVDLYDFRPGRTVTLPLAGRAAQFFVVGVWRDYGRPQGAVQIEESAYVALTGDRTATSGAVWLARGAQPAAVRDAIRSGELGSLVGVNVFWCMYKPSEYFVAGEWRRRKGGGPILINTIHEIDNLRYVCGEISRVYAEVSNATRGFEVEDTVAITLALTSGALGTFMLSDTAACARSWEQTSQENKAYPTYGDEDCYVIAGTRGSLSIPTMRLKWYARDEDRSWWKPYEVGVADLVREDPLTLQMEHFGAVIRGEATPRVSVRDGIANLRVLEAIVESARAGGTVAIAPDGQAAAGAA